jgi:hypothetical protein
MKPGSYDQLYPLQDAVMDAVFARQLGFYLTGGTALSRFHLHHRYSDDLDFFTHEINSFGDAVRVVRSDLEGLFASVVSEVDARDFKRLSVHTAELVLKVYFVGDRAPRVGLPEKRDGAYVDTVRNILSNKLGAILSRDEPRDVADLLQICRSYRFHWDAILPEAVRKQAFEREDLAYRVSTFPVALLADVLYIEAAPAADVARTALRAVADDIESGANNSVSTSGARNL